MGTIIYTREAKCKDCDNIRYYYKGKRKYHHCIIFNTNTRLNDNICSDGYKMRKEYYIEKSEEVELEKN